MTENTQKAERVTLCSEFGDRWRASLAAGKHHVFRMRYLCPCCDTPWYQDVTEDPESFASKPLPDRRALGRAMLCGKCDALSRMLLRSDASESEDAFVLSSSRLFEDLGRLYREPNLRWVDVKGMGPFDGNPKSMRDEKKTAAKAINFVQDGTRWTRRASVTVSQAVELKWMAFDAPGPKAKAQPQNRFRR